VKLLLLQNKHCSSVSDLAHQKLGCGLSIVASAVMIFCCISDMLSSNSRYWPAALVPVQANILGPEDDSYLSPYGKVIQCVSRSIRDSQIPTFFTKNLSAQIIKDACKFLDLASLIICLTLLQHTRKSMLYVGTCLCQEILHLPCVLFFFELSFL
jgi:hypothetical protein